MILEEKPSARINREVAALAESGAATPEAIAQLKLRILTEAADYLFDLVNQHERRSIAEQVKKW